MRQRARPERAAAGQVMLARPVVALTALCAILTAASLLWAAQAQDATPPGDAAHGKRLYMTVGCYECHGTLGQGGRPAGPRIAPNPIPYEAFVRLVRRPANAMPPYTSAVLSDQDLRAIYDYLLTVPPPADPSAAAILDH